MHLHIFTPSKQTGNNLTLTDLSSSVAASVRLRLALAYEAASSSGISVSAGDVCPSNTSIALVGKIGTFQINQRAPFWLKQLDALRFQKRRVIIDYTDHHLLSNGKMTPFYHAALANHNEVVTCEQYLSAELESFLSQVTCHTIWDAQEYEIRPPNPITAAAAGTKQYRGLWFGHDSNAGFLAKFLDDHEEQLASHTLVIVSNSRSVETLKNYSFRSPPRTEIVFYNWSKDMLWRASKDLDYCVIPSDSTTVKRYASSNRLVTALTLGLPTLAEPLPSYEPFLAYFTAMRGAAEFLSNPREFTTKAARFQQAEADKFKKEILINEWANLLF